MTSPGVGSALGSFLTNELQQMVAEVRKKNPELKEVKPQRFYDPRSLLHSQAADLLLQNLKNMKDKTSSDAVSSGIESKIAKVVTLSVNCINRLIMNSAIPEASVLPVLRSFSELAAGPVELQVKLLQSLLPLSTIYNNLSGKAVAEV
ncbi:hypothetical protein HDU97_008128 [Phlyctochytrium planicorne]|nr:hypothetical protein HDU97_008128 [Phlyctochytrium planicorne]